MTQTMMKQVSSFLLATTLGVWAGPLWADVALGVTMVRADAQEMQIDSALTGTIEAAQSVDIGFPSGGRLTDILVFEGDHVKKGQELARIDPLQQDQKRAVAEASVAQANAALAQAQAAYDRQSAMLARGVGTRAARDQAQQALSQARAARDQAASLLEQAQRAAEDTVLRAPFDGVVTARAAEPGQIVAPAMKVVSLASLSALDVVVLTPDEAHLDRAMGARVDVRLIDDPAAGVMHAHVTEIAPLVNQRTGSVVVKARIDDASAGVDRAILGASVRATLHIPDQKRVSLPWQALSSAEGQPAVWVIDDEDRVALQPVTVQRFSTSSVVLSGGIEEGQRVVVAGSQMLYPGRKVFEIKEVKDDASR